MAHRKLKNLLKIALLLCAFFIFFSVSYAAQTMGIYLTENSVKNPRKLQQLIRQSNETGINTFVIDFTHSTKKFRQGISKVKKNHIRYVARIVMYPGGGDMESITSEYYLKNRLNQIKQALLSGADAVQLDYIRFHESQPASPMNSLLISNVIRRVSHLVHLYHRELEVDIYGIASFGEENTIGHHPLLFSDNVNTICPMVYFSHYTDGSKHFSDPYQTVLVSLLQLKNTLNSMSHVKIIAYIEMNNYRNSMSGIQKENYIMAQITAVHDSAVNGWYVWSPTNNYKSLFHVLRE